MSTLKKKGLPDNVIPWAKPYLGEKEKEYLIKAFSSTWISGGEFVDKFESDFSSIIGGKYTVTTSNGTTALHLALLAAGIGPGDEVIVPAFTFVAPANVTIQTGAKPVFVAIDPQTWCIDADEVRKAITPSTRAIIPVHVYGNVCEMDTLVRIAEDSGIYIIEDTAEAVFSKYRGRYAGSFGNLGCFSFQATKTITTGEGGAVVTDDEELYKQMRILRSHGMRENKRYWHDVVGYNYRLTNLQAALGCAQLANRDWLTGEKKRIYNRYFGNLSGIPGIHFQHIADYVEPVIWAVALKIDQDYFKGDRDFLITELLKRKIETRPGFYPFSMMPLYTAESNILVESIARNIISLPSYVTLSDETIDFICSQVKDLMK
jgi:perosamine synthetase